MKKFRVKTRVCVYIELWLLELAALREVTQGVIASLLPQKQGTL